MSATTTSEPLDARDRVQVRRALISVSNKSGLRELAEGLAGAGVQIVSTGSTAAQIREWGVDALDVSEVTGFAETLDGRVKTLHPSVHAGILADLRRESHRTQLDALGVEPFELVVVNLYPFVQTLASGATTPELIEQIDIGGPAMVRSSAKNHANVAIVVDPSDYTELLAAVSNGGTTLAHRTALAAKAFAHTASYDSAVANWMASSVTTDEGGADLPKFVGVPLEREQVLRYGENSHQQAALYRRAGGHGLAQAELLGGKEMSFNNYVDADAAVRAAFDVAGCVAGSGTNLTGVAIIKHANPCGIAANADPVTAYRNAHECDPVSAFGGVVASSSTIDGAFATALAEVFTEVVVAPDFTPDALEVLTSKKNLRVVKLPAGFAPESIELRQVSGGMLRQQVDQHFADTTSWQLVSGTAADAATLSELEFAWRAVRSVKSNAILLADGLASVGVGMGQVNRVDSCRLAVQRAGDRAAGSVAASDAFFPFADGAQILIDAGVRAIVQPGGSVRDEEVISAAQAANVTMYFTGERHFAH